MRLRKLSISLIFFFFFYSERKIKGTTCTQPSGTQSPASLSLSPSLCFTASVSDHRLTVVSLKCPPFYFFFSPPTQLFFLHSNLRKLVSTSGRYQVNRAARQVKTFSFLFFGRKRENVLSNESTSINGRDLDLDSKLCLPLPEKAGP